MPASIRRSGPANASRAATDWVWARAQPSAFAHLVADRGWAAGDYVNRAVPSILAEVVSPGD